MKIQIDRKWIIITIIFLVVFTLLIITLSVCISKEFFKALIGNIIAGVGIAKIFKKTKDNTENIKNDANNIDEKADNVIDKLSGVDHENYIDDNSNDIDNYIDSFLE